MSWTAASILPSAIVEEPRTDLSEGISFRAIQPDTSIPFHATFAAIQQIVGMTGVSLEYANTRIDGEAGYKRSLKPLLRVPRASTLAIGAMINRAVSQMPADQCYVNVGVWNGFTLFAGMLNNPHKRCIGVDNFCLATKYADKRGLDRIVRHYPRKLTTRAVRRRFITRFGELRSPAHEFFYMDYADYLTRNHTGTIGVYMYDAMHRFHDQVRGLELAEPFLAPGCIVFVDDTNGPSPILGTREFLRRSRHRYTTLVDWKTCSNHHPTLWNGIMVLRKED